MKTSLAAAFLLMALLSAANAQTPPQLSLPLACTPGKDCFIQQYTDVDPGPAAKDYRCGIATYEGHKGTDFRILSVQAAEAGVPVLASAAGRVKGARDGMEDRLIVTAQDEAAVKDRECGNGVVIDHGGGWETQYCHMRRGSLKVREGQNVAAGEMLGMVGFSGQAQFAHVHLSVRKDDAIVDPFLGAAAISGTCQGENVPQMSSLWSVDVQKRLAYRDAEIIQTGFAAATVNPDQAEQGGVAPPAADSPALVFYARLINMRAGDRLRFRVEGPGGFQAGNETPPLERNKATFIAFSGKKRTAERWPAGAYQGVVEVVRAGKVVALAENMLKLQ
jgi:murein DD-endopeptidase MepM/ murein hydrolase activator NlpD